MPSISLTLPTAGTVITAGLHATNYTALQTLLNGGLDDSNFAVGAALAYSKLNVPAGAIVQSKITFDAWQNFTPAWTSTGVAPAIGNGSIAGRYVQIGKTVHCQILLTAGTTTTFGTGAWFLTMPVAASALMTGVLGNIRCFDSSAVAVFEGFSFVATSTTHGFETAAQPAGAVQNTVPFAWATADTLTSRFTYEAA